MKKTWLNKRNNENCILFFNGWGMDENVVKHLSPGKYDIFMFNEYNTITDINQEDLNYKNIFLVAWSLGVWVACKCLYNSEINFCKKIALNGTPYPINEDYGIPPNIFNATIKTWNEENRNKFNKRSLGGWKQFQELNDILSKRTTDNQKEELENLKKEIESSPAHELVYDSVLIGRNDLIFTTGNQFRYWNNKAKITEAEVAHFPFIIFESWPEIIDI